MFIIHVCIIRLHVHVYVPDIYNVFNVHGKGLNIIIMAIYLFLIAKSPQSIPAGKNQSSLVCLDGFQWYEKMPNLRHMSGPLFSKDKSSSQLCQRTRKYLWYTIMLPACTVLPSPLSYKGNSLLCCLTGAMCTEPRYRFKDGNMTGS